MQPPYPEDHILKGIPASPGVAHGQVALFVSHDLEIPDYSIGEGDFAQETGRFEKALLDTRKQITRIRNEVAAKLGEDEARIFDAHLLVIEDRALIDETIREMEQSGHNIAAAFNAVSNRYIDAFSRIDDEYLRERATDIRDVSRRVLHNLMGVDSRGMAKLAEPRVLVSHDITPSETVGLETSKVKAIVTDVGSRTSHAVIMARSIPVPAVVGLRDFSKHIRNGDWVLVDGFDGLVVVNPSEATLYRYGRIERQKKSLEERIMSVASLPPVMSDGRGITLRANIEGADNLERVHQSGATGVGLFRTEYLYLSAKRFPGEEEQFQAYAQVARNCAPNPVVIRTFDFGADKMDRNSIFYNEEANPFIGFRAIRFCLEHPDIFKDQLRAILRASQYGNVRVMYPMISGCEELVKANAIFDEVKEELRSKDVPFNPHVEVGTMIEVPGAAMMADALASHCSFFSIGTNDLIQCLLAIDRLNDRVAHLYDPAHPAVLRIIRHVVQAARRKGIHVSVCGEMAGDPIYVPLLLGLGVDELSIAPCSIPVVRYLIRNVSYKEMKELADHSCELDDPRRIFELAEAFYRERVLEAGA